MGFLAFLGGLAKAGATTLATRAATNLADNIVQPPGGGMPMQQQQPQATSMANMGSNGLKPFLDQLIQNQFMNRPMVPTNKDEKKKIVDQSPIKLPFHPFGQYMGGGGPFQ